MSDETKSETSETKTDERDLPGAVGKTVQGLIDVGKLWAAHGLNIGRSALETSATTLRTTADLLGELSQRFEPSDDDSRDAA